MKRYIVVKYRQNRVHETNSFIEAKIIAIKAYYCSSNYYVFVNDKTLIDSGNREYTIFRIKRWSVL